MDEEECWVELVRRLSGGWMGFHFGDLVQNVQCWFGLVD